MVQVPEARKLPAVFEQLLTYIQLVGADEAFAAPGVQMAIQSVAEVEPPKLTVRLAFAEAGFGKALTYARSLAKHHPGRAGWPAHAFSVAPGFLAPKAGSWSFLRRESRQWLFFSPPRSGNQPNSAQLVSNRPGIIARPQMGTTYSHRDDVQPCRVKPPGGATCLRLQLQLPMQPGGFGKRLVNNSAQLTLSVVSGSARARIPC